MRGGCKPQYMCHYGVISGRNIGTVLSGFPESIGPIRVYYLLSGNTESIFRDMIGVSLEALLFHDVT